MMFPICPHFHSVLVPGLGILLTPPPSFPRDLFSIRESQRPHDHPSIPFILIIPWELKNYHKEMIQLLVQIREGVCM